MADIPRRRIDTTAVIQWIRMVARSTGISSANASGFYNMGIVNGVLQWVDNVGAILRAAPAEAKYIVQTADSALQNEQALSSLSTGIMKVTTGTGVVTSVPWSQFFPITIGAGFFGNYAPAGLTTAGSFNQLTGYIPSQIASITNAKIRIFLGSATGNEQYDVALEYAAVDEQYNNGTASSSNQSIVLTSNNDVYELNVTSLFAGVTGGDSFGIRLTNDQINSGVIYFMGIYVEGA